MATGTLLQCTHELLNCPVIVQGHTFLVNMKILPLQCYDIIFGMDWLSQYSPMEIHWRNKWLSFSHAGQKIQLIGLQPNLQQCPTITASEVLELCSTDQLWCILEMFQLEPQPTSSSWPTDLHALIA